MFITTSNFGAETEGAGSQYQRKLLTYLYAKNKGLGYVDIDENLYLQGDDVAFSMDEIKTLWNKAFSFLRKEMASQKITDEYKVVDFQVVLRHFSILNAKERDILLKKAAEEFRKSVNQANFKTNYEKNKFHIALHLRAKDKTDITHFKYFSYPWQYFNVDYGLPDNNPEYYAKLFSSEINRISQKTKQAVTLHLHTMASDDDLKYLLSLIDPDIEIRIIRQRISVSAVIDFVFADVFIGSHSSFSWLALLLRTGPSYLRGGFRHFVPSHTSYIGEVLYEKGEWLKNFGRYIYRLISYAYFYPQYYYQLLTSRLYF